MKKLKKMYRENRIVIILMAIVLVCVIVMGAVFLKYFFGGNKSVYGDRLEGINAVEISDSKKSEILDKIKKNEHIKNASINIIGKIIYINLDFNDKTSLVEAQSQALTVLDAFNDEEKAFYDFQFTIKQAATSKNEGFTVMGAKNKNGTNITWNNNNIKEPEETK